MSSPHPPFYKWHFELVSIEKIIDPNIGGLTYIESLVEDIKKNGLREPLQVHKVGNFYRVEDGNHRQRALKILGWKEIPCMVFDE